jgi:hypothetical protein
MFMIAGYWVTQIIRAAATYSLADHLADGPRTAKDIATAEGLDLGATERLLRTCASLGLAAAAENGTFASTELLRTLEDDVPRSLKGWALSQSAPGHWLPWGQFPESVRTGEHQVRAIHGGTIWDYFERTPDEAAAFTTSMNNLSSAVVDEAVRLIDTTGVRRAVDVGGASGSLVRAMMRANPDLNGIVLEREQVVPDAIAAAAKDGLADRFDGVVGDFFTSVPDGDMHLLKYILHDWNDDECVRILRSCRAATTEGGRLVVIELVQELGTPGLAPLMDMNMMVMVGGRERDIAEYDQLLNAAGFARTSLRPTRSPYCLIEAVAV